MKNTSKIEKRKKNLYKIFKYFFFEKNKKNSLDKKNLLLEILQNNLTQR